MSALWLACSPLMQSGHTKDHNENDTNCLTHSATGYEFGSASLLCKRPGSV